MKQRTIQDLHNKEIGNRKFAKVCDLLIADGHTVENIKEYYEKYKFVLDGYPFEYSKDWKVSAEEFKKFILNILNMKKTLDGLRRN